ncbi:MAG: response regulator transcription factor [Candidatus Korobacteraceae bacterium]
MPEISTSPTRILLLDDHALFRESLSRLLNAEPGLEVVAHCGTIAEALDALGHQAIDLVLLDFDLGEDDGRQFLRAAKQRGFGGKILVITAGIGDAAASELIRGGIAGVFRKHDSAQLLAQGIRDVMGGKVWLDQEQLHNVLSTEIPSQTQDAVPSFTEREQQVLSAVFEGLANKEIGLRLGVSESSVKATLQQLFSKTGVRTRSQLVRVVLEQYRDQV